MLVVKMSPAASTATNGVVISEYLERPTLPKPSADTTE